ncbi:MAG: NADP-dependent phosphogluconate dehydrogenase [Chitinophagaceae bacterium]|nr:NADP-dependent phosphogluconate dehydrogenase [Chitinophagaceae bacterium]
MGNGKYDFGMVGLGVMGSNLLLNMADHGYAVVGFDLDEAKAKKFESSGKEGQQLKGVTTAKDLVDNLKSPRKIMLLVPAGKAVDSVINGLEPLLDKGDIIIDGGNSHYTDTLGRINRLKNSGIHFMGVGISGGEEGARRGPSIMPGGDKEAYKVVEPILQDVSAKVNGEPCVAYLGNNAAGHYVKMVHNGIEYSIMQLVSECYDLMKNGLGMSNDELAETFGRWNSGEMNSFLLEITAEIFKKKDPDTGGYLVDVISGRAGAKGTGKWTSQSGLDLPMPVPNIDVAVMMRNLSGLLSERKEASDIYNIKEQQLGSAAEKEEIVKAIHDTLYFATLLSYVQGLAMITTASGELKMDIPLEDVVKVWRGGCIIRSASLDHYARIYHENPGLKNMMLNKEIAGRLEDTLPAVKKVITLAAQNNFQIPGIMAAFNYFNAYRRNWLPTNLVQAQRDYFGAHTYERIDKEGVFHTQW